MTSKLTQSKILSSKLQSLLLIEHDEPVKKGIALSLMDYFEEIQMTNNINEAIRIINEHVFSLVIVDTDLLTKSTNYSFLQNIKTTKVFFLGSSKSESIHQLMKQHNYQIFEKPVSIKELVNEIIILSNKRSNDV